MRTSALAAVSTAFAAAALLTGAGSAVADPAEPMDPLTPGVDAGCVYITTPTGALRCMTLDPASFTATGSLGYGSGGTGSLMDLLSGILNTGSVVLSVELPNSTGSYAPGSLGSYGPEASIGELSVAPVASLAGAS